jgi:3-deoxy-7-phosphoheptulonate synthase
MIIVMKPDATTEQIRHVVEKLDALGFKTHLSQGVERTIIGAIGDKRAVSPQSLTALDGVAEVVPIRRPFKLVSREVNPRDTYLDLGYGVTLGGSGSLVVMAGPCSVESREQLFETAHAVKEAGATVLRGGAFKPRTSPYTFQGLGEEGLKLLAEAREAFKMPIITEVMDSEDVPMVAYYADVLQLGARNMQNFSLLKKVGRLSKPVMLKRGPSATLEEWLMAAEYILNEGNSQVILCERGIRSVETQYTRNTMDVSAIPVAKRLSHLPVIADPSHGTGKWYLVGPMAKAAIVAGADGLMIEVHPRPEEALSDGPQALLPDTFARLMAELAALKAVLHQFNRPPQSAGL